MKEVLRSFMARPIGVSMLAISVLIAGGLAAQSLPLARLPELGLPCVLVEASMPGFPAAEVRSLVAMPLEEALSALKGLRSCSSVSRDGRALLRLDFSWGSAPSLCASRTREALDRAFMVLPHGASRPVAIPYDPSREALLVLAVTPLGSDMTAAKRLAERELSARLRRIAGAGRVAILGGFQPEYVVSVDLERSAARGLDLNEVAASVAAASADVPAGTLRQGPREMPVVARGRIERIEDLRSLTLPGRDASYSLDDIASIREEPGERKSLFMRGAEEAVGIELYASPGADPVKLARLARNAALEMCDDFGSDFAITVVHDSSRGVSRAIRGLAVSALLGAAAAAAALCLFFRDLRSGALAMGVMPLAGAASLCVLALAGRSLNAMSLGGLALSMGMVSDNAVLVLSALSSPRARARGKEGGEARLEALLSVMGGSFGSAMTTVIVFLPVAFLPGILGALFGDLAISLVSAVLAGWVAAVFLLPALHQVFGGHSQGRGEPECARPKLAFLEERYRYALRKAMRRPRATLSLAAMAAFVGCLFFFAMPVSFLDGQDQRSLEIRVRFPGGYEPDGISPFALLAGAALEKLPGIVDTYMWAGAEERDSVRRSAPDWEPGLLLVRCALCGGSSRQDTIDEAVRMLGEIIPVGAELEVGFPADPSAVLLGVDEGPLAVCAMDDWSDEQGALRVKDDFERRAGLLPGSLRSSPGGERTLVKLVPDRQAVALLGAHTADIASTLNCALAGAVVGAADDGERKNIRIIGEHLAKGPTADVLGEAKLIPVALRNGSFAGAGALASFEFIHGRDAYARLDGRDVRYLTPRLGPEDGEAFLDALASLADHFPTIRQLKRSAFSEYAGALALSFALIVLALYLALGAQFESFSKPLAVLVAAPLSLAGVGPVLLAFAGRIDFGSITGMIVLLGTVVNNAILLQEASQVRSRDGAGQAVSAYAGASDRVRPVFATSASTVCALLPLALIPGELGQNSMALTLLGGMAASTLLTVFVTPILLSRACQLGKTR